MSQPQKKQILVKCLGEILQKHDWMLATAESCTGGLVAEMITDIPNASAFFDRGFVTYSNAAKIEMLDINPETLEKYGAVSEETAKEMALGAVANSHAQISLAITGIAGPSGGTNKKPVGTVCFAWVLPNKSIHKFIKYFAGDRQVVRCKAAEFALETLLELLLKS